MKKCDHCNQLLDDDNFGVRTIKGGRQLFQTYCKICRRQRLKHHCSLDYLRGVKNIEVLA